MEIKITKKVLSIFPYLSTSWSHVIALHGKQSSIAVTLVTGDTIELEDLNPETIKTMFAYHADYLENEIVDKVMHALPDSLIKEKMEIKEQPSLQMAFGSSLDGLSPMMQHNPDQMNAPELPAEILEKVGAISKIISPSDTTDFAEAVANCNCFYCQLARVINKPAVDQMIEDKDIVTEEDLHFQQWSIKQTGENLFDVTNRLDDHECYHVYLGEPVGCTCGQSGCEHILAVLKS